MRTEKDFENYLDTLRRYAAEEGFETLDETYVTHVRCRYFDQDVVIAESKRIVLREMRLSDLEALYVFAHEEYPVRGMQVLEVFLKESRAASEEYLKAYIENMYPLQDYGIWSIVEKQTGTILGLCGLGPFVENEAHLPAGSETADLAGNETARVELGYYIGPAYRRKGLASEAVELSLQYAREYLELSELYARAAIENHASVRVLEKAGFSGCEDRAGTELLVYRRSL